MEKINVAELLKNCPKGMELDCTMYEDCTFLDIDAKSNSYLIQITTPCGIKYLDKYGCYTTGPKSKCVIFPKGKTTWEGFQRPFKDGDIIYIRDEYSDATFTYVAILKQIKGEQIYSYCFYDYQSDKLSTDDYLYDGYNIRFATEEEKQKLFDAIKANGYKWNEENKTLEKLIEPKFKVGDRIIGKMDQIVYTIKERDDVYFMQADVTGFCYHIPFDKERYYELVPNKFDITTLKPFESRVLVRDYNTHIWEPVFWGKLLDEKNPNLRYLTTNGCFKYCIPYENNQHLLGTNNDCNDYYKNWK